MMIRAAIRSALATLVMRGKITSAAIVGGRTIVQVTIAANDVRGAVELLHPWGYFAVPRGGSDPILLTVLGTRDHNIALSADDTTATPPGGAQAGECGLSDGTHVVAIRNGRLELLGSGETLRQLVTDQFMALFNGHTHPTPSGQSSPPSQQMTSAQLTGALHAGGQS